MEEPDKKILRQVQHRPGDGNADVRFWCPGCQCAHDVWFSGPNEMRGARWTFNGNYDKPTFQPSILVQGTEFTAKGKADYEAWMASGYPPRNGQGFESRPTRCHTFVTDGVIQFLGDCTHALAGRTVPMEAF